MLKILHKGIQVNLDLDTTDFTGDVEGDTALVLDQGLVAGSLVGLGNTGKVALAAGGAQPHVIGFLVNDAVGYFYENKPALASQKLAVTLGNCVVITDQTDEDITAGDKLYCSDGTPGMVTADTTDNTDEVVVGVAGCDCAIAGGELLIYC